MATAAAHPATMPTRRLILRTRTFDWFRGTFVTVETAQLGSAAAARNVEANEAGCRILGPSARAGPEH